MIKFECLNCNSKKYKIVKWKLLNGGWHVGVYCYKCNKWFKFLDKSEEIEGILCGVIIKSQRKSKKTKRKN